MISDDIHELLQEYFRWAASNSPENISYPSSDPVSRLRGSSVRSVGLTDDEAVYVDRAIGALKQEEPNTYKVIKLVYRDHRSLRWLEKEGVGDRRTTSHLVSRGTQFIKGALYGLEIAQ